MNFDLSPEQEMLREAARGALGRATSIAAAREMLEGREHPDLWPLARAAGWTGLLVPDAQGGAELGGFEAMLVLEECGRTLASIQLMGHLVASLLLISGAAGDAILGGLASGELCAGAVVAMPPTELDRRWTVDPLSGFTRADAPSWSDDRISGTAHWVPDLYGADILVIGALDGGEPVPGVVSATADGLTMETVQAYDATRNLAHVHLEDVSAERLDVPVADVARAWHLFQAMIAAESLGAATAALELSVAYAKERFTFGRAIGSYQAIKHGLAEVLRQAENARSLLCYAGWADEHAPDQFALAANAARSTAGRALDTAARRLIAVHGGIGATFEHDAPYFFRRAQLSRRLLGGTSGASDRVAEELLAASLAGRHHVLA